MTDYEWLTEMGLCHKCRKNRVAPDKKFCFECLEKIREENIKRYDPKAAKKYQSRRREIYKEKKEKGICIWCNKPATHGMYCYEHYVKAHRRSMERAKNEKNARHDRGLIPDERKNNGLCLWCGRKAVDGLNCCEYHQKIFTKAGRKAAKNDEVIEKLWKLKKEK